MRVANVTISNVPGPQVPLYLAGAMMTGMFPLSIVVHGVALNITVQSYRGQLCFGLIACRRALPDVGALAQALERAMVALRKLAEAQTPAAVPSDAPAAAETPAPAAPPRKRAKPRLKVVDTAAARPDAARPRATRRRAA